MRLRPALLAVTATASLVSVAPADAAAVYPVCATRLALAPTGASASCATNAAPVALGSALRMVTVEVASGAVDATLRCGTYSGTPVHVSGPRPVTFSRSENHLGCTVTLTATDYDTTATAVSWFAPTFY